MLDCDKLTGEIAVGYFIVLIENIIYEKIRTFKFAIDFLVQRRHNV
ncbi:hypothetical protein HMPREF0367_01753 [[Eubacterium] cylindroides ATCC 27803]|uniref:Uncharacterized protein n=1 Tax=Faecalitalea cylindroides ATCC 27803 TaxID=649755 RepID=U2QTN8_9FIRM|nr:hypothetical protein HMPREF0367_01753 [[Eubacterium] cylindroides ATCC 27803] [Faecalitalea cylindroides ATCC 27803]